MRIYVCLLICMLTKKIDCLSIDVCVYAYLLFCALTKKWDCCVIIDMDEWLFQDNGMR